MHIVYVLLQKELTAVKAFKIEKSHWKLLNAFDKKKKKLKQPHPLLTVFNNDNG